MRIANELTLRGLEPGGDDVAPRSEILLNGEPTAKHLAGAVLEAAVQWTHHYVLFITDDVPYEEMLRVVLLDAQLAVIDSARIGGPYATGSFSALRLEQPNTLRFRFIGDTDWQLELLPRARFRLPFFSEPPGVYRGLGFSRHFIVRGNPQPRRT